MKTNDEIKKLHEKYIVVQRTNVNNEYDSFCITLRNNFKTVNLCDCFDNNGAKIRCESAQCYSLDNSYSGATKDCLKDLYKHFKVEYSGDYLKYNFDQILSGENDMLAAIDGKEIYRFIKNWSKNNEKHTKVKAWTYWSGVNYRTLFLPSDFVFEDVIEIDNKKQDAILSELPENFYMEGDVKQIETENYLFTFIRFRDYPFFCEVYEKQNKKV
jgi:hypothetical protein